jgi:anti-sigma regulatory factor (Ser/Thr protein kinase)
MADTASHRRRSASLGKAWTRVFPAQADQIGQARQVLAVALDGCPAADDAVLCLSELATNSLLHSDSRNVGGTFTVHAEIFEGDYVWIEVVDNGGPWWKHNARDGRAHGLDIVADLAVEWGVEGDSITGWTVWARLKWWADRNPAAGALPARAPCVADAQRPVAAQIQADCP